MDRLSNVDAIRKRKIIVAGATSVILFNVVLIIYVLLSGTTGPADVDAVKLLSAVSAYKQQLRASHKPIPATVSAQELIVRGLLAPADIKGLGPGEITVSLRVDPRRPSDPIIRVRGTDGHEITVLADGSVHDIKP